MEYLNSRRKYLAVAFRTVWLCSHEPWRKSRGLEWLEGVLYQVIYFRLSSLYRELFGDSKEYFLDFNWYVDRNSESSDSITILRKDEPSATRYPSDGSSKVPNRNHSAFSCDGLNRWLAVGFEKDATEMFDLRTGQLMLRLKDPDGAHLIEFLRVGEVDKLVTAGGQVARIWDPISG